MTMIRQYPPQPQPSQICTPGPYHQGPYNSLPPSPRTATRRALMRYDQGGHRRHLPQQYAYPLQRTISYPLSPKESTQSTPKPPEHMLRRKTPNGILAAAYDGTSVEEIVKPPAMKHILLPVTSQDAFTPSSPSLGYGLQQDLPLRPPSLRGISTLSHIQPINQPMGSNNGSGGAASGSSNSNNSDSHGNGSGNSNANPNPWNSHVYGSGTSANDAWKMTQLGLPQIDSMLNQIPANHPQLQYQLMFCGAIQPSLQSPLGPTVSNDQPPYGPYWPNGTFIPYRPAAMRDARYYSNAPSGWAPRPQDSYVASEMSQDWQQSYNTALGVNMGPIHPLRQQQQQFQQGTPSVSMLNHNANLPPLDNMVPHDNYQAVGSRALPPNPYRVNFVSPQGQVTPVSYGLASPRTLQDPYSSIETSGQTTPRAALQSPMTPTLPDFGPYSSNAQLRERVFTWAHSVYIDLLKYLQHTRRHSYYNRIGGPHHSTRPNIYPKPPRQPSATFSSPQMDNRKPDESSSPYSYSSSRKGLTPTKPTREDSDPKFSQLRGGVSHNAQPPPWPSGGGGNGGSSHHPAAWGRHQSDSNLKSIQTQLPDQYRTLRRSSASVVPPATMSPASYDTSATSAVYAVETLTKLCNDSTWQWIDGMLLVGCLAYALGDYNKALGWYSKILDIDSHHVEAMSNLAATLLALERKPEAEQYWRRAVKRRPGYFEAVEHLVGLLCGDHRTKDAVGIIEEVERALRYTKGGDTFKHADDHSERAASVPRSPSLSELSDRPVFDYETEHESGFKELRELPGADQPGFGSSGYAIPGADNGRMLALVHAKGNMLYSLGDNVAAAKAFDNAVMIGAGRNIPGISSLIKHILAVVTREVVESAAVADVSAGNEPILLLPEWALQTAKWCFPSHGELPGLRHIAEGMARRAAVSTTSNSLLSLAKIFQDGMANSSPRAATYPSSFGVREILALYYLSLSLQPSPSTANNVGILLASVQQAVPLKKHALRTSTDRPKLPGVPSGSGVALALEYYHYGLGLDSRHAHLYTNLGSLLKDVGHLDAAIQMYEQAVACDGNFDIALANLANAVKDKGRISDAINYYRRAVTANPDFAEAICGLANALNSVCHWAGRGGIAADGGARDRWHVNDKGMLLDARTPGAVSSGWIKKVITLVEKQLADGEDWGKGAIDAGFMREMMRQVRLDPFHQRHPEENENNLASVLQKWAGHKWEGARVVRLVERTIRRLVWQWYQDKYIRRRQQPLETYRRPQLPAALTVPAAPTVLPFHTFTCPMSAKQIRLISQRNGLRISTSTLRSSWMPGTVFPPPPPPSPYLRVGYVSSDFNNHPLAHLMQSVFGLHNRAKVKAYCYATTASDGSVHRLQIEKEAPMFYDASNWSAERLVNQIVQDGIHILVNLNGYTRGARNEVFAARPAPIQMSFMGFAGTLGAEWCDYLLADETAVPLDTLRPWRRNVTIQDQLIDDNSGDGETNWVYGENIVYCKDTFFCCDHRQSAPDAKEPQLSWEEEQARRWRMRKEIFPSLPDDAIILGNFNQLYKIEPTTFRTWLRILAELPKAILWLLRFPDLGETHLRATATAWAGPEVASRILFTDVAPKHQHIARARVCDLFLDTPECNAHTTAADILWSGTPLLTLPRYKYKMCSRMAASILKGALPKTPEGARAATELIVPNEEEYEARAVELGRNCRYEGHRLRGRLAELRKLLYESRWTSALFDTRRWVRDLEQAYGLVWTRWERGEGGDVWLE